MRFSVIASLVIILGIVNSGCAVHMAANAPSRKDVSVLMRGTPRDLVHAELGAPVMSREEDGKRVEIFKFMKGYTGGEKFFHGVGHGIADVFTLGLWEAVGTPSEAMAQDNEIVVKVMYDSKDDVDEVIYLKKKN